MACTPGYYGLQCNISFTPGFFGELCAGACHPVCSKEKCYHVYGCVENNTDATYANLSGEHSISTKPTEHLIYTYDVSASSTLLTTEKLVTKTCTPGYYGLQCNISCTPGFFGELCAGSCHPVCSKEKCHHVYGCVENNTDATYANLSGEHSISTKPAEQLIYTYDVSASSTLLTTEKLVTKSNLIRVYLLTGFGIISSILMLLIILHIYQTLKEKRERKLNRQMEINVCTENGSLPFPNDSVYHDIGECTEMMQIARSGNISRKIERPKTSIKA